MPEFIEDVFSHGADRFVRDVIGLIDFLRKRFSSLGFRVDAPARLHGKSGAEYWSALSASKAGGQRILVDICVSNDKVGEEAMVAAHAKMLDTSPSHMILFALPRATANAAQIADSYSIRLIEGISLDSLVMKFEEKIGPYLTSQSEVQ